MLCLSCRPTAVHDKRCHPLGAKRRTYPPTNITHVLARCACEERHNTTVKLQPVSANAALLIQAHESWCQPMPTHTTQTHNMDTYMHACKPTTQFQPLTIKLAGLCLALSQAHTLLCCLTPTQQLSLPLAALPSSCCPRAVTNLVEPDPLPPA
jgi:hypothetical protein